MLRHPIPPSISLGMLISIVCCAAYSRSLAEDGETSPSDMRIRLKDGSFGSGRILASQQADHLGWLCEGFTEPFHFDILAIRSISRAPHLDPAPQTPPQPARQGQFIEMSGGAMIVGRLISIDERWLTVASDLLGTLQVNREEVSAVVDAAYAGQIVYSGPVDDERWQRLSNNDDWEFEAGALVATKPGATIVGNVELPTKSQVNLALSWRGTPDFVMSLGTLASNKISKVEEVPSAARLEVWDKQLALVREVEGGGADIAMLRELTEVNPRIELSVYLDQEAGIVVVCDAHGRPIETLQVESKRNISRPSVHLANHGQSLTIERFEVREWDGIASTLTAAGGPTVLTDSGEIIPGAIVGYDSNNGQLSIMASSGDKLQLPLASLRRGDMAQASELNTSVQREASRTEETNSRLAASEKVVDLVLLDRTRLRGRWVPSDAKLRFEASGLSEPITFGSADVRGVIGTNDRYRINMADVKSGTLKTGDSQWAGYLDHSSPANSRTGLHWRPFGSSAASEVSESATGAIIYRLALPVAAEQPAAPNDLQIRRLAPAIGMFLGNRASGDVEAEAKQTATGQPLDAGEILFRTGDAINGQIVQIDEKGLTFKSSQTQATFADHELVQRVYLRRQRGSTHTSTEKMQRLMTVPRAMKNDPPTHLLVSVNGDYLRGRLVSVEGEILTIEIRLALTQIPVTAVSQIIWLHDRDWNDAKEGNASDQDRADVPNPPFQVHAITANDRGLTFKPKKMIDGVLSGASNLLGECSVSIEELNQLLFGRNVGDDIRAYRDNPWGLSLAQYPRVYLEDGSEAGGAPGTNSLLVGKTAPDFVLKSIDDQVFRLSKNHDRVLVLDFWASWCGPCIQTMPLVEEVVEELGGNDLVQLVAVNIQETAARAQTAVERLNLSATVLLDSDGQAAAVYGANAIPQTVIVDRDGNVTHVFVGGGPKFVAQFREALRSVVELPN